MKSKKKYLTIIIYELSGKNKIKPYERSDIYV